ncbi:MAG: putative inner membrane transporter protein TsaS [Candidatus Marinimicrobia bacterium]|nr:putative inner membrane transporter protein TsaS [Candidatus Neomarinimicrobiota bacterium]
MVAGIGLEISFLSAIFGAMELLSTVDIILICLVIFSGAFTQSILGFGGNFISVGILALWLPAQNVIVLLAAVFAVNNILLILLNRRGIRWQYLQKIVVLVLIGGGIGAFILPQLSPTLIYILLGITIIGLNVLQYFRRESQTQSLPKIANTGLLFSGGLIQGAIGTGGPLIVTVLAATIRSTLAFRGTANVIFFLLNGGRTVLYIEQNLFTPEMWNVALFGMGTVVIAAIIGHRFALEIPDIYLRRAVTGFLIIIGIALLGKAIF